MIAERLKSRLIKGHMTSPSWVSGGMPYRLRGYQLPLGHWALMHGVNADWILGGDDVLRPT